MLSLGKKKQTHIHMSASLFSLKKKKKEEEEEEEGEKKIQLPHSPTGFVVKMNFKGCT